jgi:hypothetical protein
MATNFFSQFPQLSYDIDGEGSYVNLTDISRTADISTFNEDKVSYYTYYEINDGDRPDTVSQLLYGTPEYYWTLFILNDSLKAGLNSAWPLSSNSFETMISNEYDKYSALVITPQLQTSSSIAQQYSDFSIVPLNAQYLPYLRLSSLETQLRCNIAFYDSRLLQLAIHSITAYGSVPYTQATSLDLRTTFLNSSQYVIDWVNPYNASTQAALYAECQSLKAQWVDLVAANFETVDSAIQSAGYAGIAAGVYTKEQYVFAKKYTTPGPGFTWPLYRNAVNQYFNYDTLDSSITLPESAFDILEEQANTVYVSGGVTTTNVTINAALTLVTTSDGLTSMWTNAGIDVIEAASIGIYLNVPYDVIFLVYNGNYWELLILEAGDLYGTGTIFSAKSNNTANSISPLNLTYTTDLGVITVSNESGTSTFPIPQIGSGTPVVARKYIPNITNYEKEQLDNDAKRKIKVVRPDKIRDFSKTYFTVLNS